MDESIRIMERPEWISYEEIHSLLLTAHERNRTEGFHVKTVEMTGEELEKHIGKNGMCFVAVDGEKLVGVTAVRIVERHNKFVDGRVADQILVAVLPDYSGRSISSALHEKVVEYAETNGLRQIELRTADRNNKMQTACLKWGFHYMDFVSFPGIDHYTVVMMKWLSEAPPASALKIRYSLKRVYIRLRFKQGKVKRFGI